MMFLNDEKFKEVETWLNDCTNEYTSITGRIQIGLSGS